jgi:hypothetical protein
MMTLKQTQPTLRTSPQRDRASGDLDPAEIGATLSELALRVYRVVRDADGLGPDDSGRELDEVRAQIVRLQQNVGTEMGDEIARYVSAVRALVEERLAGLVGIRGAVLCAASPTARSSFPGTRRGVLNRVRLREHLQTTFGTVGMSQQKCESSAGYDE